MAQIIAIWAMCGSKEPQKKKHKARVSLNIRPSKVSDPPRRIGKMLCTNSLWEIYHVVRLFLDQWISQHPQHSLVMTPKPPSPMLSLSQPSLSGLSMRLLSVNALQSLHTCRRPVCQHIVFHWIKNANNNEGLSTLFSYFFTNSDVQED